MAVKDQDLSNTTRNYNLLTGLISRLSSGSNVVVLKLCFADPKGSATGYQGIRGYISVMTAFKFTFFFKLKE